MSWRRGSAALWSRDARAPAAAGQRTVTHPVGSLGPSITHVVAHLRASAQTGAREPAVVHPVVRMGTTGDTAAWTHVLALRPESGEW